ncbi:hypothetical protein BLNAU_24946 [Blattamonas nauphoetae]|uniref:Uncharacterized protein n=1 Tax=Blattamonas nauphoetae TaxID=2049346 RepID=A0ABQ9WN34_9EUKA|nr:hypothetical protein BLNAU_24946 [Blattamonas nauphoetae]
MQRPRVRNESAAKCFTFYLKPLGGNNAGFDSVLLFFKVHKERDGLKIDDLCVMFIQSTLAKEHPISDTGANLMFLWLALLCAVQNKNKVKSQNKNKVKLQIENRVKEQLENKDIYKG